MKTANSVPVTPLQKLTNGAAIKLAEAQFRLARLFTPYGFEPERCDFDRVTAFVEDIDRAFPNPTQPMANALDRIRGELTDNTAMVGAFAAQDIHPTLSSDQLFTTAKENVTNPSMARAA
jgi:hypothetical protein